MNDLLPLLRLSVYAPLLFKMGSERKLTTRDRMILRLAGLATLAYNGYLIWGQYQSAVAAQGGAGGSAQ